MYLRSVVIIAVCATSPALALGKAGPEKRARASRATQPPEIDGVLDDAAWKAGSFFSDFLQQQPDELAEPSYRTEIAFAFDSEALYVAARMYTGGLDNLSAPLTRRDDTGEAERIIVSFDTFRDRRTAYSFAVTAAGVRADWFHPDDASFPRDKSYDPVWKAEVRRTDDRWTAEMRIPFSQLRFPDDTAASWGLNINRYIPQRNEDIFWVVVPRSESGWSSYFGELEGLDKVSPSVRVELLPYMAADSTVTSSSLVDDMDPFNDELGFGARAGLDAKVGLGPNLTLDATINPDFGQVEADPAEVNLSAFESFFEERRPFFIEGRQLLETDSRTYFNSRRIGSAPRGNVAGDFVEVPAATRILGAAKLTGRLPSRITVGGLTAVTSPTDARAFDIASDTESKVPVEPLATYNVLRLVREFGHNSSRVGATLTGVYRAFDGDTSLSSQFARSATTGGVDWNLRFLGAQYELAGNLGFSAVRGEPGAITALQTNAVHSFQRPDQDHVKLDPTREQLSGWTGRLAGGKRSGSWRWGVTGTAESPGFDINDAGLLFSGDDLSLEGRLSYQDATRTRYYHRWETNLSASQEYNFGGVREASAVSAAGSYMLPSFWSINGSTHYLIPGKDDALTRGGPLVGTGGGPGASIGVSSPFSGRTKGSLNFRVERHSVGAPRGVFADANLEVLPADRVKLAFSPRYSRFSDNRQFVDIIEDAAATDTFGSRYLLATVARRELALQTRAQLAFSPEMIVELYAEPFISSGKFDRFGELPEPGSRDLREYDDIDRVGDAYQVTDGASAFSFDDPDFTVLSLRSTLVLRWEFLPGSTLFLVWQQSRFDALTRADQRTLRRLDDTFRLPGTHVVALKVSYWWPID